MPVSLTDSEIAMLMNEIKPFPEDYRSRIQTQPKRGHRERELEVEGSNGSKFRVILRQSLFNPIDFSIILAWIPPNSTTPFRLCRYNGKSHEHSNSMEGHKFYDFHIHKATKRYQESGSREDTFAEQTNRYQDFESVLQCMIQDCSFQLPKNCQGNLF